MTQVYIIAGIVIAVFALVCYVFMRQTITKRHKEKIRLHKALDKRAKDLVQILNSFPAEFLPRDLQVFLYRCIVDVYEQLSKLMPSEPEYLEHFKAYTVHMESAMRAPKTNADVNLQSNSQINEIRQNLNFLGRFMQKWMERGNISGKQYAHYKDLLKKLVNQLTVDNYILSAKQSMQIEKPKLAMHYYVLAKNLLNKEGIVVSKQSRLNLVEEELGRLEQVVRKLEEEAGTASPLTEDEIPDDAKQWQEFDEDANWKKKNIYD